MTTPTPQQARGQNWHVDWHEIVQSATDWVYALSPEGLIIDCNPQMCRALKVPKESLIGSPLLSWVSRDDRPVVQRGLEQLKTKWPQVRTTRQMQASDKTLLTQEAIETPHVRDNEVLQISGIARDISEEVVLERKLWDEGESHGQALDFALRTSLGLVKGYVYALGQAPDLDVHRRKRYISVIEEEIEHLGKLLEDVLDMQKLDAASLEIRGEFIDPLECVRSAVEQLKGEAERREIEILCHLPQTSKPLFATVETVRRIALNLLQNAVQHTLHSGRVQVEWIDKDEWAELRVRDHGNGIPEQIIPHIFDRFYRGPGHHGDTPGIGLGLAVTQMFVTALGGRIHVESAPGKGSEFTVILPRRYVDAEELLQQGVCEDSPASGTMRTVTA